MDLQPEGSITEEFLKRVEAERREILFAYDHGYGIDSNEVKTDDSILPKLDRYGFIHDSNLPNELTEGEKERNNLEKSREKKWISMLERWPKQIKSTDKLTSRVFKGVPNSLRGKVWAKLLDIETQKKLHVGVYEKMKQSARKYSLDLRQIDLDINRTFRDNITYRKRYCQRQVQLFNVLAAYSIYNTEIGYCQGMSNICALLLMYLSDEEDTFWALSELMSNLKYSMHGLFKKDFPKLLRLSERHDLIIRSLLPNVYKRLEKCNISSLLYTTKWFLQCYLDALPFSLVLRIWDVYLLRGDSVLLSMAYCILKTHKRHLKRLDMDSLNQFLKNQLQNSFGFSDDEAILRLQECMDTLKRYKFDQTQPIPPIEVPTQPFGQFNKITRELIQYHQKKQSMEQIVEQFKVNTLQKSTEKNQNPSLNSIDDSDDDSDESDEISQRKRREFDKESLASEIKTEHDMSFNTSVSTALNSTIKRAPSDYDNVTQQHYIKHNNQTQSPNTNGKNVARIIMHKDNIEFVRGQYGIYTRDQRQQQQLHQQQPISLNVNTNSASFNASPVVIPKQQQQYNGLSNIQKISTNGHGHDARFDYI